MSRFWILGIGALSLLSTLSVGCATTGSNLGGGDTHFSGPAHGGDDASYTQASFKAPPAPRSGST